jgi:hypothetical protein
MQYPAAEAYAYMIKPPPANKGHHGMVFRPGYLPELPPLHLPGKSGAHGIAGKIRIFREVYA